MLELAQAAPRRRRHRRCRTCRRLAMGRALPSSSARSYARVVRCTHKTTVYVYAGRLHTTRRTRQRHVQGFIRYGAYPVARRVTCEWDSNGQSPRVSFSATTPIRDRPQPSSGFSRLSAESSAPSVCTQQQHTAHATRRVTTLLFKRRGNTTHTPALPVGNPCLARLLPGAMRGTVAVPLGPCLRRLHPHPLARRSVPTK